MRSEELKPALTFTAAPRSAPRLLPFEKTTTSLWKEILLLTPSLSHSSLTLRFRFYAIKHHGGGILPVVFPLGALDDPGDGALIEFGRGAAVDHVFALGIARPGELHAPAGFLEGDVGGGMSNVECGMGNV